ncbi:MAG: response regulator [Rhodocyclaceae bacterium]
MATILVVDDRAVNREFMAMLLGYAGHQVVEAVDGGAALARVRQRHPDLIISDIVMPTMDGVEFARRVRADAATAHIPIIFYTASYRLGDAHSLALGCGVVAVISKPSRPQVILDAVAAALGVPATMPKPPLPAAPGAGQDLSLRLSMLIELGLELSAQRDPQQLLDLCCRASQEMFSAQYAAIGIVDAPAGRLERIATCGFSGEACADFAALDARAGLLCAVFKEGKPCRLHGLTGSLARSGLPAGHPPIDSLLLVPLKSALRSHGWLYVANRLGDAGFSETDEQIAMTLAAKLALAYENLLLSDSVQHYAARLESDSAAIRQLNAVLEQQVAARQISEARFRLAMEAGTTIAYTLDRELRYTWAHSCQAGFDPQAVLGKTEFDLYTGETAGLLTAIYRQAIENGVGLRRDVTVRRLDQPSEASYFELVVEPQCNAGGVSGVICAALDITRRVRVEEALREAKLAAEQANRAKSVFLASMSHEIRTPLSAVVGLIGLLADSPLDRRQRDYADKIQLSAQALRALVDDILDFSRIEAGALQLEHAHFSLNAILRTVAAVVSVGLRGKAIEIVFDVAPCIPDALLGDAMRLQQILLNLASNAVKFTESGEIIVMLRPLARESGRVTLQFAVRDTGIGIPVEQLDHIFDVFTQADASTSRQYGGSGLGLAISARLAELMGGRIGVDSVLGQGSEFRFGVTFDVADDASAAAPDGKLSGLKILIVDDHPLARDVLTRSCAGFGWQASAHDCGAAGLAELRRSAAEGRDYDLMLLDWQMPGMDGLAMLRQAYAAPDIALPLVVLMVPTFELEQAVAASDDLYLDGIAAKPLTPASLFDAVRRAHSGEFAGILPASGKVDRRLAGLRLLVAEDNAINQQVIEQILTRAGAEVVIVGNGLVAVEALRSSAVPFDALLMDIQMPVLDGYAATRVIREELGRCDLPIIALTAHAQSEDHEKSRRAGMVGHLVKPIEVEDLLDLVGRGRRSAPDRRANPSGTGGAAPADSASALPGLDFAGALEALGGDRQKYRQLLRQLLDQHADDIDVVRRLIGSGDTKGAARRLHQLCGGASFLRAGTVARLAAASERAVQGGNAEVLPPLLDELQAALDALGASIDRF